MGPTSDRQHSGHSEPELNKRSRPLDDPTLSLQFSKTITPADDEDEVDWDLINLFSPKDDSEPTHSLIAIKNRTLGKKKKKAPVDDWEDLLDDSIEAPSHALREPATPTRSGATKAVEPPSILAADPSPTSQTAAIELSLDGRIGRGRRGRRRTGRAQTGRVRLGRGRIGLDAVESNRARISLAVAMVAVIAVVAMMLVPSPADDGGAEIAADSPEAANDAAGDSERANDATLRNAMSNAAESSTAERRATADTAESAPGDEAADDAGIRSLIGDVAAGIGGSVTTESTDVTDEEAGGEGSTSTDGSDPGDGSSTTSTDDGSTTTTEATTTTTDPTEITVAETSTTTAGSTTTTAAACSNPTWNLVLDEQFNGSGLNTGIWQPFNQTGNEGFGLRRPEAIHVGNGVLSITAQMQGESLVSGGMNHRHSQLYGRYEFRVKTDVDPSNGMSGVVLTWPESGNQPRDGENNIYETLWDPGTRTEFYSFIHKPNGTPSQQDYTVHAANASQWHTMVMEWTPGWIKIYRDGALIKTLNETSADLIPDAAHRFHVQLDAFANTISGNVTMQVDYAKVWSYGGC